VKRDRGFTLIEIIVAVAIAAILAVMGYQAMESALSNRDRIRAHEERLRALQFTMRSLVQDLSQLTPRPVRQPLGVDHLAAISSNPFMFTRGGWTNPVGLERSTLQRVQYVVRDQQLFREYWLVLDAQLNPPPVSRPLLDGVVNFQVRFMDEGRQWQSIWPPSPQNGAPVSARQLGQRPRAVEVTLELKDFGVLTRIIEVPG
jgi:general secretion pathway protein J